MHFFRHSIIGRKLLEYYKVFDTACALADELGCAIANNKRIDQTLYLPKFLEYNEYSKSVVANLTSATYNRRMYDMVNCCDVENETTKLLARIDFAEEKKTLYKKNIQNFMLVGGAAAVIIMIMWLLPLKYYGNIDYDPLSESVSLILSDGQIIAVDQIADHTNIVDENETVIIKNDNSIIVEKKNGDTDGSQAVNFHTLNVPRGFQHDIVLEDGTHVWLNSGSTLKFPSIFGADERRVFLTGEGYFEVVRDTLRKFIVETRQQTVTVLGTEFNIYAYPDEQVVYATLVSGSVKVRSGTNEVILSPNQCSELSGSGGNFIIKSVDSESLTAWRNGMLVFDNNTLEQVLQKISRSYNVEILFDRQKARNLVFQGNLPRYDDIEKMLENIEMAGEVKFEKQKDKYIMMI